MKKSGVPLLGKSALVISTLLGIAGWLDAYAAEQAQPTQRAVAQQSVDAGGAQSASGQPKQRQGKMETLSTVVVTGSHILGRTVKNSNQPIDVLSQEQLRQTGAINLSDALQSVLPSINLPQQSFGDVGAFERPFQLRGMSPDDTLVLVDGKRWHRSALLLTDPVFGQGSQPYNMNTIPMSAIDHIEVLRNGASAIYGSDALAGVINVILKKGSGDGSIRTTVGKYSAGDGGSAAVSTDFGVPLGDKGWMRVAVDLSNQAATNRAGVDERPGFAQLGQYFVLGVPQYADRNALVNMQYSVTPDVQFYAFGHYSRRVATPQVWSVYGMNTPEPFSPLMAGSALPDGFTVTERGVAYDNALTLGLRGNWGGWAWDISANAGGNRVSYNANNTLNFALLADTGSSPTNFHSGVFDARQQAFDVDITRAFDVGAAHPLNLALGAQWLRSSYKVSPGDPASYYVSTANPDVPGGSFGFPGWSPEASFSSARRNLAEYAQLEMDATDKLNLSLAVRHSHYSDFGSNTSAAFSWRYALTQKFAVRGTASTGFRAPTLPQEDFSQINLLGLGANNPFGLPVGTYAVGLAPPTGALASALGGKALQPELAHNYTVGFVWTPSDDWTATLDLYKVKVSNQVMMSDDIPVALPVIREYLAGLGLPPTNFLSMQYFLNAATVTTTGVDVVLTNRQDIGQGTLFSSLAASYHRNKFTNIVSAPPVLESFGVGGLFVDQQVTKGLLADSSPRSKFVLNERYNWGHWEVAGTLTRYGRYTGYAPAQSAPPQTFSPEYIADVSASYFLNSWTFRLGVNNLFNNYPDRVLLDRDWRGDPPGTWPYSALSPFGFSGTQYFAQAVFNW